MAGIEFFIIFPVAALHLAVLPWRKWFDLLVADAHLSQCFLKKRQRLFLAVAHFILSRQLNLNTGHSYSLSFLPFVTHHRDTYTNFRITLDGTS